MDLYTWHTPNGKKPAILLAELDWSATTHLVDLSKQEQKSEDFLARNPNGQIPVLVDGDVVVFESGAILEYLADKAGRFLPKTPRERALVLSWVYWQVGGPGPFFGQLGAFSRAARRDEEAVKKFRDESRRLIGVLSAGLRGREWIAGDYSIADMMSYPWFAALGETQPELLGDFDLVRAWVARMAARPAVQRGMALDVRRP